MGISIEQFLAAQCFKVDFKAQYAMNNPNINIHNTVGDIGQPNLINFMFKGFLMADGKLFIGTGAFKSKGKDAHIQYSNWKLFDANGQEVNPIAMNAEELDWYSSRKSVNLWSGGIGIDL